MNNSEFPLKIQEDTTNLCNYYFKKYLVKKDQPLPSQPVPFTLEDFQTIKYLIKNLNNLATEYMKQPHNFKEAYPLLVKADKLGMILSRKVFMLCNVQKLLKSTAKLRSLTFHSLGCYFKFCDKLTSALKHLEKACKVERRGELSDFQVASSYLEMCELLKQLCSYKEASDCAKNAVVFLEKAEEECQDSEVTELLSSAYFTYGETLQYLGKYEHAQKLFEKSQKFPTDPSHVFVDKFSFIEENSKKSSEISVLYQCYKKLQKERFKVIILDKPHYSSIKVLAFPNEKHPVYRINIPYKRLQQIAKLEAGYLDEMVLQKLTDLLYIEDQELKLANLPPTTTVTAEKDGAKFSITMSLAPFSNLDQEESLI